MKREFEQLLALPHRNIVIHETYPYGYDQVLNVLAAGDFLFFDDCLYSQYVFIRDNIQRLRDKNIICILGFSSGIFRKDHYSKPIRIAYCAEFHDRVHKNDQSAFNAYMSITEIRELLTCDNVFLAGHGHMHLQLENSGLSKIQAGQLFASDIKMMSEEYAKLRFKTNIFVFPYAYDSIFLAYKTLRLAGFRHFFAGAGSQRIQFEGLI